MTEAVVVFVVVAAPKQTSSLELTSPRSPNRSLEHRIVVGIVVAYDCRGISSFSSASLGVADRASTKVSMQPMSLTPSRRVAVQLDAYSMPLSEMTKRRTLLVSGRAWWSLFRREASADRGSEEWTREQCQKEGKVELT